MAGAFILFVLLGPVVEMVAAVLVASRIGYPATFLLVVSTSLVGIVLIKAQGLAALNGLRSDLAARRSPGRGIIDGTLRVVGALLLALPGLVSSVVGILLLIAPVRMLFVPPIAAALARRATVVASRMRAGRIVIGTRDSGFPGFSDFSGSSYRQGPIDADLIDAEGWDVEGESTDGPIALPPGRRTRPD